MLNYRDRTIKKEIAMHYATQFANEEVRAIVTGKADIKSKDEATALCEFFWEMVDRAAKDTENKVIIAGEENIQFWVEKMFNIIHGHLDNIGYIEQWEKVCDRQE